MNAEGQATPEQVAQLVHNSLANINELYQQPDVDAAGILGEVDNLNMYGVAGHPGIQPLLLALGRMPEIKTGVEAGLLGSEADRFKKLEALLGLRQPAPGQADLAPASPAPASPSPPERPAPRKGFIGEIDDSLANATESTGKVSVTPQALALYLQELHPQDASLQNIIIEILGDRSVQAWGKISKMGTSSFVVNLGADQDGGELKVVSKGLTNVAMAHQGRTGEINQALGDILSTLQKKLDEDIADKTWHATGFSISADHQELVINFTNGKMEKARKDLAGAGVGSLKQLIREFNLERPKLADLARPVLQKQGKTEPSQEELDSFAPQWVNWLADQIVKGRVPSGDSAVEELFVLIDKDDAQAIKDKVGEKLAAADTPWASAWRSYLEEARAVPTDYIERLAARSEQRTQKEFARSYLELAITMAGRDLADERNRLRNPNLSLEEYARGLQGDQARQYLEDMRLSPNVMAEDIFQGRVLPDEEIMDKINEMLINEGDKEALRNQISVRVEELAGRRESLSPEEQAWWEAWEKELQGREKPFPDWEELGPPDLME